jgi:hypothetical protein
MANFYFTSPAHRARFLTTMREIHKIDQSRLDSEYASAVYVLTSSAGTWEKARPYVSGGGIEFEGLLAEVDWSSGYRALLQLAANLFNENNPCSPVDLMLLDDRNFAIAMTAFQIRRHAWPESEFD